MLNLGTLSKLKGASLCSSDVGAWETRPLRGSMLPGSLDPCSIIIEQSYSRRMEEWDPHGKHTVRANNGLIKRYSCFIQYINSSSQSLLTLFCI